MDTLIFSQTVFYIVSSLAIIVVGCLLAYAGYALARILRNVLNISDDVNKVYNDTKKRVKKMVSSVKK